MKSIAVIGAFDTKGEEYAFLMDRLKEHGLQPVSIDMGIRGLPPFIPDYSASEVAKAAGVSYQDLRGGAIPKAECLVVMAHGALAIVKRLYEEQKISGIISMGGGQGANMACEVFRNLPLGFPKVLMSTTVCLPGSDQVYRDLGDTVLVNSVVDVSGLNSMMRMMMTRIAVIIAGLVNTSSNTGIMDRENKNLRIGISMFGVTTPCVEAIRSRLEEKGYEVFVFHANGMGGRTMERLIEQGVLDGVADVTLAEFAQDRIGVYNRPVPNRLESAAKAGIPQVVSVGALDMVQMVRPFDNLPDRFRGRQSSYHNKNSLFVRSSIEENSYLGKAVAEKLNASTGKVVVCLPLRGISALDKEKEPFYFPEADEALFASLKQSLSPNILVKEVDLHINDPAFGQEIGETLAQMLQEKYGA